MVKQQTVKKEGERENGKMLVSFRRRENAIRYDETNDRVL